MSAQTKITQVTGHIIPLQDGTRLRIEASTYSTVRTSYNKGARVEITEVVEYLESDPEKPHIWKGDKWGKVSKVDGVAVAQPSYMAILYHNVAVCSEQYTPVVTDPDPEPEEPQLVYPEFILVGPSGKRQIYYPAGLAPEEEQ